MMTRKGASPCYLSCLMVWTMPRTAFFSQCTAAINGRGNDVTSAYCRMKTGCQSAIQMFIQTPTFFRPHFGPPTPFNKSCWCGDVPGNPSGQTDRNLGRAIPLDILMCDGSLESGQLAANLIKSGHDCWPCSAENGTWGPLVTMAAICSLAQGTVCKPITDSLAYLRQSTQS